MFRNERIKDLEQGVLYMVYSSFFLSLLNFSVKGCIGPLGVIESTFLRYFAPLVLFIPILTWKKKWHELRTDLGFSMHLLRSVCAVMGQIFLNYYLTKGTLVNATMLWATGPIYVPILTQIFFRQKTPLITWITIVICLIGVWMMIKPTHGIFDPFSIWGICAGVVTAFSQILWGHNVEKGSITENLFYLFLFSSVMTVLIWVVFGDQGVGKVPDTLVLWIAIAGMAVTSIGNQIFRSRAYQKAPPYLLTPILYVSVVGAGILDVLFYHNWPDIWGYIGFILVAIGTLIKWWYLKKISSQFR